MEAGTVSERKPLARPEVALHGLRTPQRGWLRWLIFREAPSQPPTVERFVWFSRPARETSTTP